MANNDDTPDGVNDEQGRPDRHGGDDAKKSVDYELTAKDAGWRSPRLFVSRTKITCFDPPRLKKPRDT